VSEPAPNHDSGLPGTVAVMVTGPVLQFIITGVDLAFRPIPGIVYAPISILIAATTIIGLILIDLKKRPTAMSGPQPFHPSWIRALAWIVIFVVVLITVELGLFKYRLSLGSVVVVADCASFVEMSRDRGRARLGIAAQSDQIITMTTAAAVRDWAQPTVKIERFQPVQLSSDKLPLSWSLVEGTDDHHAIVEIYDVRKPTKFDVQAVVVSRDPNIPDPCSLLEFGFDIQPRTVALIDSKKWHRFDWITAFEWIAGLCVVLRAAYAAVKRQVFWHWPTRRLVW
jgi:hypothetical protein